MPLVLEGELSEYIGTDHVLGFIGFHAAAPVYEHFADPTCALEEKAQEEAGQPADVENRVVGLESAFV